METNVLCYGDNLDILRRIIPDESVDHRGVHSRLRPSRVPGLRYVRYPRSASSVGCRSEVGSMAFFPRHDAEAHAAA